jgi:hypothetical protein
MPDLQARDLDNYAENQDGFAATGCRSDTNMGIVVLLRKAGAKPQSIGRPQVSVEVAPRQLA